MRTFSHIPVLIDEAIEFLGVKAGGIYADLTFGEGGHSEAILKKGAARVIAVDRDSETIERYKNSPQAPQYLDRLTFVHDRFSTLPEHLPEILPGQKLDGILVDLGVSTRQLLEGERGFSFQTSAPLDMRMDRTRGKTLGEKLENVRESELVEILERNAGMRKAKRIASDLMARLRRGEMKTTADLASLMGRRIPGQTHPATELFMALRIWVNEELDEVEQTFPRLVELLKPNARLCAITFHSVEDRTVKQLFRREAGMCTCGEPWCVCPREARAILLTKKPVTPSREELYRNPRARSAKLRCIEKKSEET